MSTSIQERPIVVVGAGIAGLCAAIEAKHKSGARVLLCDSSPGGRARSKEVSGGTLNLGAHALYDKGELAAFLRRHRIRVTGGRPNQGLFYRDESNVLCPLPTGTVSLLRSRLTLREKKALSSSLLRVQFGELPDVPVSSWLESFPSSRVRALLGALVQLSTYAPPSAGQSARAAGRQLRLGAAGVTYVDGGWQSIVDGLLRAATDCGVEFLPENVRAISSELTIETSHRELQAGAVVLAIAPSTIRRLVPSALELLPADPLRASCLDLVVEKLPHPERRLILDTRSPRYLSIPSRSARQASRGEILSAIHYGTGPREGLEQWIETLQPGALALARASQWLPKITVAHSIRAPAHALRHSRSPMVSTGIFLAGDWLSEAMLADASALSGARAGTLAADFRENERFACDSSGAGAPRSSRMAS